MTQYGFYMDLNRCTGCKTCELACKDYKDLPVELNFRRIYEYAGGTWQNDGDVWHNNVFAYYISIACNHCSKPACTEVCPTDAIKKDKNGFVTIDDALCIGCGSCSDACPYDAPQIDESREKMTKCDGCTDRVMKEGKKPICVEACPLRALDFGPVSELRKMHGALAEVAPLAPADETQPNIVIKPNPKTRPVNDESGRMANPLEV